MSIGSSRSIILLLGSIVAIGLGGLWSKAEGQTVAFPGAEGYGRFAQGGRGGTVIEVTTLNDSGSGSLRAALTASGPRIVVFRIAGTINLLSPIIITSPFLTVAGQTAPGGGILVKGNYISIRASEVIIRYLRVRPGISGDDPNQIDALSVERIISGPAISNVIIDHCSMSWAEDEVLSTAGGLFNVSDVTVQWSIIGEGLRTTSAGRGVLLGGGATNLTMHHSLLISNQDRNPNIQSGDVDFVNNFVYNPGDAGSSLSPIDSTFSINFENNYYQHGPMSHPTRPNLNLRGNAIWGPSSGVYFSGNIYTLTRDSLADPESDFYEFLDPDTPDSTTPTIVSTRFSSHPLPTMTTATQARADVLIDAGANKQVMPDGTFVKGQWDPVDQRYFTEINMGTGIADHFFDPTDVGGYPTFDPGTPPQDSDHDGMPDSWETQYGFNPNNPGDGQFDSDGDSFTNLEEYLNETDPLLLPGHIAMDVQITTGADDVEQYINDGVMYLDSSDLELGLENGADPQIVGLRFNQVEVPQGATIKAAFLTFTVDEPASVPSTVQIGGEATANPIPFTNETFNLSGRLMTAASVTWNLIPAWTGVGTQQQSPDLTEIVQEMVDDIGWTSGQAMVFLLSGTGERTAESYEGDPLSAPTLHVEYTLFPNNNPPSANNDSYNTLEDTILIVSAANGMLTNDSDPNGDNLSVTLTPVSGPSHGAVTLNTDGSFTYTPSLNFFGTDSFIYEVSDGKGGLAQATVTITVASDTNMAISVQIANAADDAEEYLSNGEMYLDSSDLELGLESGIAPQVIGLRFSQVAIPAGSTITSAHLIFTVDELDSVTSTVQIVGEAAAVPAPFTNQAFNLSNRPKTAALVTWNPVPVWTTVGSQQQTPELTAIVQEIVDGSGWAPGQAMVFLLIGTGERTAESYEGAPLAAPVLQVEFAPSGNNVPTPENDSYNTQQNMTLTVAVDNGVLINDTDPDGDLLSVNPTPVSGPANGSLTLNSDGNFVYTPTSGFTGEDFFVYEVSDGKGGLAQATVTITVTSNMLTTINVQIANAADDAEEYLSNGEMYLDSSDLELGLESGIAPQVVGLRFSQVVIPAGSTVTSAHLIFTVDELDSVTSTVQIVGEAAADPAPFSNQTFNLSNRPKTAASVPWNPVPVWTTVGSQQQTPDLTAIVQEIVDGSGWAPGQAMVFFLTGTGERTAESYEGAPLAAPVLHVEYSPRP